MLTTGIPKATVLSISECVCVYACTRAYVCVCVCMKQMEWIETILTWPVSYQFIPYVYHCIKFEDMELLGPSVDAAFLPEVVDTTRTIPHSVSYRRALHTGAELVHSSQTCLLGYTAQTWAHSDKINIWGQQPRHNPLTVTGLMTSTN